jgi:hypothetical protein
MAATTAIQKRRAYAKGYEAEDAVDGEPADELFNKPKIMTLRPTLWDFSEPFQ